MLVRFIFALCFSLSLMSTCFAVEYGPKDHAGATLTLLQGDVIYGLHQNVGTFYIPVGRTVYVKPYSASQPGTGFVEIRAAKIEIDGAIMNAAGAGYQGGGGAGGGGAGTVLGGWGGDSGSGGGGGILIYSPGAIDHKDATMTVSAFNIFGVLPSGTIKIFFAGSDPTANARIMGTKRIYKSPTLSGIEAAVSPNVWTLYYGFVS